jgi:GNAT superfamily N-acetyltransferase
VDEATRIRGFARWFAEAASTRSEPWRFGTAWFDDDFPVKWDANYLHVERALGGATARDLAAEADRVQDGLRHRELVLDEDGEGARVAAGLVQLGYGASRLVTMVRRREADRAAPTAAEEASFDQVRTLLAAVTREHFPAIADDELAALADHDGVLAERVGTRFVIARVDDEPVAYCQLYEHDGLAQIEDVNTRQAFRGRGLARAVVGAAVQSGLDRGADLVFLTADDADWPKQLYAKLGFDETEHHWRFTRRPEDAPEIRGA